MEEFLTNEQVVAAARRHLDQSAWDYLVGASESETTMRRNRLAFDRWGFLPRVLVDVSRLDPSTSLMGHRLRIPVILAPVGSLFRFDPEGASASGRAAEEFGILQVVSSANERPTLEEIAASSSGPKVYQLYIRGDMSWIRDMVARIKAANYDAFCLTVDTAVPSRRDRAMLSGYGRAGGARPAVNYPSLVTWDMLDQIKALTDPLPFYLKGIARADDARIAVEHGVNAVWVSNHGGRQLDHGLGTLDTLPDIVQAVSGRADIILDGGVQRGSDIVKAVSLGATAVAIGKLQGLGLAANGKDGLVRVLEILEQEMLVAMGLLGVRSVAEMDQSYVCRGEVVTPPHEMSSWPNMPGGRLL
jgi:glycolate oxidase